MILRNYQQSIFDQVVASESNDLIQLDTGAGKTPIIAKLAEYYGEAIIVCHRNILIKQASEKLSMCGLPHRIIASNTTKRISANNSIDKIGAHCIDPNAEIELVSIDTINNQIKSGNLSVNLNAKILLIDEAHHLADDNKWAALAAELGIRCVGFTATPIRGDGFPMLEQYGGYFARIVQAEGYGVNATERLISEGYLAKYSAYYAHGYKGKSDYKQIYLGCSALYAYDEYAEGRQAICIEPRIVNACETVLLFKRFGVNAEVIHSGLPQYEIERILQAFEAKHIKVLVAVDMINEGFDVPDADVLIISRVVKSFGLYRQLCGRVLRPRDGKHALILDLNGESIATHGLPSDPIDWTKRQGQVRRRDLTICKACNAFIKATLDACPECGEEIDIKKRGDGGNPALEKYFFDADMVIRQRKRLADQEQEKLKKEEELRQKEMAKKRYFDFTVFFGYGVVARRCEHFYKVLDKVLREKLEPYDYNMFFNKNHSKMGELSFYAGVIDANFDKEQEKQCMRLYEARK